MLKIGSCKFINVYKQTFHENKVLLDRRAVGRETSFEFNFEGRSLHTPKIKDS